MTSLQRSMVLSSLRAPRSGVYILQAAFDLLEPLDLDVFKEAWRQVAARHSALRTSIEIHPDGEMHQCVRASSEIQWEMIDGSPDLSAFLKSDQERGFDFAAGIPIRFSILGQTLVWTAHHALLDGRSYAVLWGDVFSCYDLLKRGEQPALQAVDPEPQSPNTAGTEKYWREYLAVMPPSTGCIVDRIHPPGTGQNFGEEEFSLSRESTDSLWNFAEQHGVTVNTLVLAAWAILLSRYGARQDITFGVTRTGRGSVTSKRKEAVGLFINTVPFRLQIDSAATLRDWLRGIRHEWVRGRDYESTPLESIQHWSDIPPGTPLFDSVLVYDNESLTDSVRKLGGLAGNCTLSGVQRADAPITVVAYGRPRLSFTMLFDANMFSPVTMKALAGHLRSLLTGFLTHAGDRLSELSMLTEGEKNWLVQGCNSTASAFQRELCAHHLFEQQAQRTPTQIALEDAAGVIDYRELNARANRLAGFLQAKGAGPEDLIAVCMERSSEAVVALLGVLKAGAAFLPVDPSLPADRLASILGDAQPKLVLTYGENAQPALNLDLLEAEIAAYPAGNLACTAQASNAAYAVYTSGSTGQPKGLVVTHRSLVNHTIAVTRAFGITAEDRRLQFAPMGTDVFVAEVFNYLCSGATLVIVPGRRSVHEFARLLEERRITITAFTGTWWSEWVAALAAGSLIMPASLRALIVGMEQTNPDALLTWRRLAGSRVRWFNAYGPSEASPTSTIYEAGTSEYECAAYVPIGRPIANTQAYVLDRDRKLVPAGVAGELYLGGEGVARGYLARPELSAEKFSPDPFRAGSRLYRTGDLVFRLPDGNLVFIGRIDRQVKIRGFRIELEEIEAVLAQHPAVRQCAVTVGGTHGREQLRAYVCLATSETASVEQLRIHMARRLPDHMLPSSYAVLSEMPVGPSGKLDRKALPQATPVAAPPEGVSTPVTDTERRLSALWCETLKMPSPALTDNFFACGGDSLRATRLITLIYKEFGTELALTALFRSPTLAAMAALLEAGTSIAPSNAPLAWHAAGSNPAIFCLSAFSDDASRFSALAGQLDTDQPFFAIAAPVYAEGPLQTVEQIASRVCQSIREIRPHGPYILGGYCFGGLVAFESAQQFILAGEDVKLVVLFDTAAPGYPKLLKSGGAYWRQLRILLSNHGNSTVGVHEIAEHIGVVSRLLQKKLISKARRTIPPAALPAVEQKADPRAHAASLYTPKAASFPVAQFIAAGDVVSTRVLDDPRLGWQDVCPAGFEVRRIAGAHPTLFLEHVAGELAAGLQQVVSKFQVKVARATSGQ